MIQLYLVDNTIIAIADVYLKKEDQYIVKAYEYSLSGVLTENTKEVLKLNVKSRLKAGVTGAVLSQDRKSFLVHNVNFDDKDDNAIIVKVFDSKLNLINEYNEEIKLKSSTQKAYVTIGNFILNNLGNVYFTKELMYYKGAFSFTSEYDTDRDYFIVIMDSKGTRTEVPVELKNLKVARMGLMVDKDNTIKLAGFYYKKQTKGLFKSVYLRGSFYVELAPESRKKVAESSAEFSDEMMLEYRSEKQLAKGVYLPSNFYVKEIRNKPDGGTVIIAEFFDATISSGNNLMENIKYLYGDLIVVNISNKGVIEWSKAVYKKQIYTEARLKLGVFTPGISAQLNVPVSSDLSVYYSYLAEFVNDDIVLIFNDSEKNFDINIERKKIKEITQPKKGVPMMVVIDGKGEMEKTALAKMLDEDVVFRPKINYIDEENDKVIIYGSSRKVDKLGRMTIK